MDSLKPEGIHRCISFFELLLDQFRGPEGELHSATKYLLNSTTEQNHHRRSSLIRIAREKIENAESLAAILLSLAQGTTKQANGRHPQENLHDLLTKKSIKTDSYEIAKAYAKKISSMDSIHAQEVAYSSEAKQYLAGYIALENQQIAIYERLCDLTENQSFLGALKLAKSRKNEHKETLIKLLAAASGEVYLA